VDLNSLVGAARRAVATLGGRQRGRPVDDQQVEQFFANMTDGVAVYEATADGQDFVLRILNDASLRVGQLYSRDAVGGRLGEHLPDEIAVHLREVLRRVLATGEAEKLPWYPIRNGRTSGWFDNLVYRLSETELVVVFQDVTAQHQAEEALRESREVLHGVLNAIPVRVFWKDRDLVYLGCNNAFARDAGFENPEDLVGKDDYAMGWREQAELYRADDRVVIASGEARLLFEEPQTTPSGEQIHLLTSKIPLRDAAGAVVGVLGTYYDISAHRRAERDYRTLFREMLDGVALHEILCDEEGNPVDYRFLAVNPAFERLLGLGASEIVGRTVLDILPGVERYWIETYGKVALTGEPAHFESYSRDLAKEFRVAAFRPAPGQFACIIADITVQRRAEAEQRRLEDQLRQSQKLQAVGQLAAGIAHEINTPAQFVADNVQFLATSLAPAMELIETYRRAVAALPASPECDAMRAQMAAAAEAADIDYILENVPPALSEASDGVTRISTIIKAMKEFAHPDQATKAPADLNRALEATLTIARNEYKFIADVETEFGDLPLVVCHIGDLNQVFLNLLVNAADAIADVVGDRGDRGTIRLRTSREGDKVHIEISDTGSGIPDEIRERVFEPFYTTKPVGKGSGQGLAMAHAIVVGKHGGELDYTSEVGKGTTFSIRLDIAGRTVDPAGARGVPERSDDVTAGAGAVPVGQA
jgi:two-component system, NtrC family, sensor kinase